MSTLLELSAQYRASGNACKARLREMTSKLEKEKLRPEEQIRLRREITIVTAMTRDCLATANYLKRYDERRRWCERRRTET